MRTPTTVALLFIVAAAVFAAGCGSRVQAYREPDAVSGATDLTLGRAQGAAPFSALGK